MGIATCPWESIATNNMGLAIVGFIALFIFFVIVPGILIRKGDAVWYKKKGKKKK
jgi:hypothetical protein